MTFGRRGPDEGCGGAGFEAGAFGLGAMALTLRPDGSLLDFAAELLRTWRELLLGLCTMASQSAFRRTQDNATDFFRHRRVGLLRFRLVLW